MIRRSIFGLCRLGSIFRRFLFLFFFLAIIYFGIVNIKVLPRVFEQPDSTRSRKESADEQQARDDFIQIKSGIRSTLSIKEEENVSYAFADNNNSTLPYMFGISAFNESKALLNAYLPMCLLPENNTELVGHIGQAVLLIEDINEEEIVRSNRDLRSGGRWAPSDCRPLHKVAIIIPYRDRKSHLMRLLDFLIPILKRQRLDFRFIVTEQYGDDLFNKGRIMNAAFVLAQKLGVDCVIFHDVDMFPQDDRSPYGCSDTPRHLGAFVNTLGYQLWYKEIVGGALTMNMNDYISVNGYSNMYWAWGGEDDDMGTRILALNYTIERPNDKFVRYSMLKHVKRKRLATKTVYKLLQDAAKRFTTDGLNEKEKWKVVKLDVKPLYYHLLVDVGKPPMDWKDSN